MRALLAICGLLLGLTALGQQCCTLHPPKAAQNVSKRVMDPGGVLTVPVVVHVVHLGEAVGDGTNISAAKIEQALELVNDDFRKAPGTPGDGIGVDTEIEFCLASRDPEGNPTTGIVRHDGSGLVQGDESYALDGVTANTFNTPGISDSYLKNTLGMWDRDRYCNIWVVSEIGGNNGGGGIQGYAYLGPGSSLDGVVQLYNTFGTLPPSKVGNMNRVTTHELGHYLRLYHTFDNTFTCDSESNCETQGDRVCDTPPTLANFGCTPDCPGAMVENYMDYTSQTCRSAFTEGQRARMRDCVLNLRPELDELACLPPQPYDVAVTELQAPAWTCLDAVTVAATFTNLGTMPLHDIALAVGSVLGSVDLDPGQAYTLSGPAAPGTVIATASHPLDTYGANDADTAAIDFQEGSVFRMELQPDYWSNEIAWQLLDEGQEVVLEGGQYPVFLQDSVIVSETCVVPGCYTFRITDTNGDGLCAIDLDGDGICDVGGSLTLAMDGTVVHDLQSPQYSVLELSVCTSICAGDLDGNGTVDVGDLLILLTSMGNGPAGDLDGDGFTDTQDLLLMLAYYGGPCGQLASFQYLTTSLDRLGMDYDVTDVYGRPTASRRRGFLIVRLVLPTGRVQILTFNHGDSY